MTELEKIAYAKSFIDKLADGINPIDGAKIPEGEVARNPRLTKCFLYVSEILSNIVEKPSVLTEMHRTPGWEVTPEVLTRINCTAGRVSISAFAGRIDEALCSSRKFTATVLNQWLLFNGYLMYGSVDKKNDVKRPTQKGIDAGFLLEDTVNSHGKVSFSVRCNVNAQCLMRDQLADIVAFFDANAVGRRNEARGNAEPFTIKYSALSAFEYSKTPLLISQITQRLNAMPREAETAKLSVTTITEWLMTVGLLELSAADGRQYKLPTAAGRELGISTERRSRGNGTYSVALYNMEAQKFIVDNLNAIVKVI